AARAGDAEELLVVARLRHGCKQVAAVQVLAGDPGGSAGPAIALAAGQEPGPSRRFQDVEDRDVSGDGECQTALRELYFERLLPDRLGVLLRRGTLDVECASWPGRAVRLHGLEQGFGSRAIDQGVRPRCPEDRVEIQEAFLVLG